MHGFLKLKHHFALKIKKREICSENLTKTIDNLERIWYHIDKERESDKEKSQRSLSRFALQGLRQQVFCRSNNNQSGG